MKKYNHAFEIAFSLVTTDPTGENVTAEEMIKAFEARLKEFKQNLDLILECAGMPYDSYCYED